MLHEGITKTTTKMYHQYLSLKKYMIKKDRRIGFSAFLASTKSASSFCIVLFFNHVAQHVLETQGECRLSFDPPTERFIQNPFSGVKGIVAGGVFFGPATS